MLNDMSEKNKCHILSLICRVFKQTHKQPQKQAHRFKEQICCCQRWVVEGGQKVKTFCYKINVMEDATHSMVTMVNNTVSHV